MAETYEDKVANHVSEWEMENFRVCYDDQVIFLCGAEVLPPGSVQTSMRGHFYHYCLDKNKDIADKIILAENFKKYLQNNHYPDLITFEHDVASISSLVVIFLESSGSIAELGVFCNVSDVNKKLLIFVPSDEVEGDKKESFIYLGPLLFLKEKVNEKAFKIYPKPTNGSDYSEHLEIMADDLAELLPRSGKFESFDPDNLGHIAFLICRIVHLVMPIKLKEILNCLKIIGINKYTLTEVERILFLLETLGFINIYPYGDLKYYYSMQARQNLKLGKNKTGFTIDEAGIFTDISVFINDNKLCSDKKRRLVLKGIKEKHNGHN